MLSRDILEEQELAYALSLIEDMERESNETKMEQTNQAGVSDRKESQVVCCRQEEEQRENPLDEEEGEEEAEQNPSPWTLREMRRAYFEGLESRSMASEPVSTRPVQTEREPDCAIPVCQTEPPRRRLRSGRSY
uniref:Uncharacterized protein n=1 Tax=viral metagenome TaxID=1070528 RepID=A0A6C0IXK9_9ZZZZ